MAEALRQWTVAQVSPSRTVAAGSFGVEPLALQLAAGLDDACEEELLVCNRSPSTALAFKIKTNNPDRYAVRPNMGYVRAGDRMRVTVHLPAKAVAREEGVLHSSDKLQVLMLALLPDEAGELEPNQLELDCARGAALSVEALQLDRISLLWSATGHDALSRSIAERRSRTTTEKVPARVKVVLWHDALSSIAERRSRTTTEKV